MSSKDPNISTLQSDVTAPADVVNHISEVRLHLPGKERYIESRPNLQQHEIVE